MSEAKRFTVFVDKNGYGVIEDANGELVFFKDYAAIKAERDALAAENAAVRASIPEERFIDILNENMDDVSLAEDIGYNTAVKEMRRDIETPATDAYLNSVRAEGIQMLLNKYAPHTIASSEASECARQLRAGKDGE